MTGSNLPPGVTDAMIDARHDGSAYGYEPPEPDNEAAAAIDQRDAEIARLTGELAEIRTFAKKFSRDSDAQIARLSVERDAARAAAKDAAERMRERCRAELEERRDAFTAGTELYQELDFAMRGVAALPLTTEPTP